MLQIIVTLGVVVWFFLGARRVGKPPALWAFYGFLAMAVPAVIWAVIFVTLIRQPVLAALMRNDSSDGQVVLVALVLGSVGLIAGLIVAAFLKRRHLTAGGSTG